MVRNTPDNVNNLMQFCCILARTDTEAVAVRYENLPEDCAYGIDIFDSDGKRKAFAGFWKNGSLNRVFLPEPGIQAGCFLSLAVDLDVCAFDETFGKAPILEIWQRNRSRKNNIACFGHLLIRDAAGLFQKKPAAVGSGTFEDRDRHAVVFGGRGCHQPSVHLFSSKNASVSVRPSGLV